MQWVCDMVPSFVGSAAVIVMCCISLANRKIAFPVFSMSPHSGLNVVGLTQGSVVVPPSAVLRPSPWATLCRPFGTKKAAPTYCRGRHVHSANLSPPRAALGLTAFPRAGLAWDFRAALQSYCVFHGVAEVGAHGGWRLGRRLCGSCYRVIGGLVQLRMNLLDLVD